MLALSRRWKVGTKARNPGEVFRNVWLPVHGPFIGLLSSSGLDNRLLDAKLKRCNWEDAEMKMIVLAVLAMAVTTGVTNAAEKKMTGAELNRLLSGGKTIGLGGPGSGYDGSLVLKADGTGEGSAKTDDGKKNFILKGTWKVQGDKFCRTWAAISDGKEVCETWMMMSPGKVKVLDGKKELGTNYW